MAGTGSKSNFLLAGFPWEVVNQVDNAQFVFLNVLPLSVWECNGLGCATRLQVITDNGAVIAHGMRIGQDMHVCTADYVQTVGRVHCGERRADGDLLDRRKTSYIGDASDAVWEADYFSRLISGHHSWTQTTDPWQPAEDGIGGAWSETPWTGQSLARSLESAHNLDLGACSVFVPWKWEDRDPRLDPMLGPMLGDRGLAELTLDEFDSAREASASTNEIQDVAWFFDAFTNLWPREIPSEFHYQVTGTGARQVCLRSYFSTNTELRTRPSGPNIIAESIVAGFTALFGIGDCKTHPMSVRFCGELGTATGAPTFTLDDSSVRVEMEPYSRFKPSCNNKFVPLVKEALADGVEKLTDAVITKKLASLTSGLPFEIRRIELSPSGAYLVVAEDYNDSQYARMKFLGIALERDRGVLCRPELGDSDFEHVPRSPYDFTVSKRGITR